MSTQAIESLSEDTVRRIADERDEPEWLLETRLNALSALETADLPDVIQTPGRRWTDLEALDFESLVDPLNQADETERTAGDDEVVVLPFTEALAEYGDVIEANFGSVLDPEHNYLTALSVALFTTGTFVYVPEGVDVEDVTVRAEMNSRSLFSQTLVVVVGDDPRVDRVRRRRRERRPVLLEPRRGRRGRELERPVRLAPEPRRRRLHLLAEARRDRHVRDGRLDREQLRLEAHPVRHRDRARGRRLREPDRRDVLRHGRPALRHQRPRVAPGGADDRRPRHPRRARRRGALRLRGRPGRRRGRVEHLQLPAREHADAVGRRRGRRVAEAATTPRRPTPRRSDRSTPRTCSTWRAGRSTRGPHGTCSSRASSCPS